MDNTQLKAVATFILRDLVNQGVIPAQERDNQWYLTANFAGMAPTTAFPSKDAIVTKLSDWYADHFAKQPGYKVA